MANTSTATRIYAEIKYNYDHASWIAGVILDSATKPTTRLKNMLRHLRAGREFSPLSFRMPYEGFFVDGVAVRPEFLLDNKANDPNQYRLAG